MHDEKIMKTKFRLDGEDHTIINPCVRCNYRFNCGKTGINNHICLDYEIN
ncbi:hypothetical protein ES702_02758 [subsurface metagenome]